jgi:hypothetical protein
MKRKIPQQIAFSDLYRKKVHGEPEPSGGANQTDNGEEAPAGKYEGHW